MGQFDTEEWDDDQQDDQDDNRNSSSMKELRKADRAKARRIKELEDQVSSLSKSTRERSVKDVLGSRGLNPKIAAFIPQDIGADEEAISKWLDEYGDVFGAAPQAEPEAESDNTAALRQMDAVTTAASTPAGREALEQRIANASTPEELDAVISGR